MTRFVYVLPAGRLRWEVRIDLSDLDLSELASVARAATDDRLNYSALRGVLVNLFESTKTYGWARWIEFATLADPPTVLELVNLIDTGSQFYRRKAHALIAARAIAILIGGEVQEHGHDGVIQEADSYGNDPRETKG